MYYDSNNMIFSHSWHRERFLYIWDLVAEVSIVYDFREVVEFMILYLLYKALKWDVE